MIDDDDDDDDDDDISSSTHPPPVHRLFNVTTLLTKTSVPGATDSKCI